MNTNIQVLNSIKNFGPAKFLSYHFEHIAGRVRVTQYDWIVEFEGDEDNFCWFDNKEDAIAFIESHNLHHTETKGTI